MSTLLRIPLSEETYQELSKQAEAAKKPVEYLIAERIPQIANSNSVKPLVIADSERQRLEKALGKNFTEAHELVKMVEQAMTLRLDEYPIPLTPFLLNRLKSRCFGMPFDKFVELTVKRSLEEFCGLR